MSDLEHRISALLHDASADLDPNVGALVRGGIERGRRRRRRTTMALGTSGAALAVAALVVPLSMRHEGGGDTATSHRSEIASATSKAPGHRAKPGQLTKAGQIHLPLARYLSSARDEKAYFKAVNMLQKSCAERFGVKTSLPVAEQPSQVESDTIRRYGIIDAAEVARYGYQSPPSTPAASGGDSGWNPSARELVVMNRRTPDGRPITTDPETGKAIPDGGCSAEGFRLLDQGQTSPALNPLVDDLLGQAWTKTMADPRALAAARRWSVCMAGHGYHFEHRWDAGEAVGGHPESAQIAMAELDLGCATRSGYITTWYAVDSSYQDQLIEAHRAELDATLADQADVMERVEQILHGK